VSSVYNIHYKPQQQQQQKQQPFNGLFSRTTWVSRYQKGKTSLDLNEARDDGVLECTGISWTICKQSMPRSKQITTPTPYRSIFTGRMLFLTPNQQCQSTEGTTSHTAANQSFTHTSLAAVVAVKQFLPTVRKNKFES